MKTTALPRASWSGAWPRRAGWPSRRSRPASRPRSRLVRSGAVYGVVHIPANWERDGLRHTPQPVVLYDNAQFSLVAGIVGGDVRAAVSSMGLDSALASEARFGGGLAQAALRLGGVQADLRTLFNPSLSYEAYFAGMLLPVALHLFCVIAAVSALGREFRNRSVDAWLHAAGGSLPRALLGKLAPLAVVYLLLALAVVATFAGWRGWPAAGSLGLWMVAIAVLMIVSIAHRHPAGRPDDQPAHRAQPDRHLRGHRPGLQRFFVPARRDGRGRAVVGRPAALHPLPAGAAGPMAGRRPASAWAQGMAPLLLFIAVPLLIGLPLLGRAVRQPARWGGR